MPCINYLIEHQPILSFRAAKVAGMFDVSLTEKLSKKWNLNIPFEDKPWNVGLIVGASGSGKTTIATQLFGSLVHNGFNWNASCLLDDFAELLTVKAITETLSRVGFSSPPQWLLPYAVLSNGQKFRVELARCLLEYDDLFVFDEFTSVVDRQVAQIGAYSFGKAIKRANKQFVAITCHYDVEAWLQPDWVLDVSTGIFKWGCLRRPQLEFKIQRIGYQAWELFKEHHYLNASINKSAICFGGFLNDRIVAFDAWLPMVGLRHGQKGKRGHRTVVMPDFQGLGLGNRLFTTCAQMWAGLGYRVFSGTAHPAEIKKRIESKDWLVHAIKRSGRDNGSKKAFVRSLGRVTCRSRFIGAGMTVDEATRLLNGN